MKLFDFKQLKIVKAKRKDLNKIIHKILIPKGYNNMPFLHYIKQMQASVEKYVKDLAKDESNRPFYLQALIEEKITKTDLEFIYSAIETAFANGLVDYVKEPNERRLGLPKQTQKLNMKYLNIKKLVNSELKNTCVGFEVKTINKLWNTKWRMVK